MTDLEISLTGKHSMEAAWQSPYAKVQTLVVRKDHALPESWASKIKAQGVRIVRENFNPKHHEHSMEMNIVWRLYNDCKQWRQKHEVQGKELVIFLDRLQDPQNVGNIIRSAKFFDAKAIVIPKSRSAKITETIVRTSVGAALLMPVIHCTNLVREMKSFQDDGFFIWGLSPHVTPILADEKAPPAKIGLVVGSEGQGMASLTEKTCDQLFRLSTHAGIESLNASSAAAIAIYETSKKLV